MDTREIIVLFDLTSSTIVYNCNPKERCENGYQGNKVPNPEDCFSYYLCLEDKQGNYFPSDNPIKCPDGSYYDAYYNGCYYGSTCERTPYFDGSECSKESYVCCDCCDECTPYCDDTYLEIADPYDCRSYYLCLTKGFPTDDNRYTCKEGEYFDASLGR
ncbi:hypothetical protein Avbf_16330 [Armadillidium vulgare]|nr:hypothetical protein Avbf_16330 [Armadillidium vulgare]